MEDCVTVTQEEPRQDDLSKQLFKDTDFMDVTLVSRDGFQQPVHRAVLCASSGFLRELLLESLQQNTFLYLGLVDHQVVQVLVEFLYLGRCNKNCLIFFLKTVAGAKKNCNFFSQKLEEKNLDRCRKN